MFADRVRTLLTCARARLRTACAYYLRMRRQRPPILVMAKKK
jgi:hypothetical protein